MGRVSCTQGFLIHSSRRAACAVTYRHFGKWTPLMKPELRRAFLLDYLCSPFFLLKNFLCVLGNQLLWLCISLWIQRLHSLRYHTAYSLPNLQHVKRNWLQRLPAAVIHKRSNPVSTAHRSSSSVCILCTHIKHTSTYLCGSCVHVWGRPDRGRAVDPTHLLHKCKDPDPAFCQKETQTQSIRERIS